MSDLPGGFEQADYRAQLRAKMKAARDAARQQTAASSPPAAPADPMQARLQEELLRSRAPESEAPGEEAQTDAGPVGSGPYVVRNGDCISSIAVEFGHFWKTIWDDPANSEVKTAREDPNVLLAGDRLTIPDKQRKEESIAAEQRHRFVRKGEPSKVHIRLLEHDEPLANLPYTLQVDGREPVTGTTDGDGNVMLPIPGNARRATLKVGQPDEEREYELDLGTMPPVSEYSGVQRRLRNLGYYIERIDGKEDEATKAAVAAFQRDLSLEETGEADADTRDQIQQEHGS